MLVKNSTCAVAHSLVGTAFFGQVSNQIIQSIVFHGADKCRLPATLLNDACGLEVRNVMRQGRAGYIQLLLYLPYREAVFTGAYQQAHNPEPRWITYLGENIGSVIDFHGEILVLSN